MAIEGSHVRSCGMRCSTDLRQRVVEFVRSGGSKAEAARRFKVGEASVYRWLKPGGLTYQRPGPRRPRKLDWEQLRGHVEDHPDRTQAERARHFQVSRHGIWNALRKLGVTQKNKPRLFRTRSTAAQAVSPPSRAIRAPRQTPRVHR